MRMLKKRQEQTEASNFKNKVNLAGRWDRFRECRELTIQRYIEAKRLQLNVEVLIQLILLAKWTRLIYAKFDVYREEKYYEFKLKLVAFKMTNLLRFRQLTMGHCKNRRNMNIVRKGLTFMANAIYTQKVETAKKVVGEVSFSILNLWLFDSKVELCTNHIVTIQRRIRSVLVCREAKVDDLELLWVQFCNTLFNTTKQNKSKSKGQGKK